MPYAVAILVLLLCAAAPVSATDCAADQVNRVAGGNECLVMRAFGEPAERTTLVIFLHGDGSRGGPSDYMYADAGRMAAKGIVTVALIRPGYYDSANNHSTGYSYREDGDGYQPHVIEAVATAVTRLKEYYRADRVILAGHSGGSAIAGVIIGKYPDLAQAAVLGACPCNVPEWREMRRGHNSWHASLSPHDYVDDVATTTTVIAVTGSSDSNTDMSIARSYITSLRERGIDANFVEAEDIGHNGVQRSPEFMDALRQLLAR